MKNTRKDENIEIWKGRSESKNMEGRETEKLFLVNISLPLLSFRWDFHLSIPSLLLSSARNNKNIEICKARGDKKYYHAKEREKLFFIENSSSSLLEFQCFFHSPLAFQMSMFFSFRVNFTLLYLLSSFLSPHSILPLHTLPFIIPQFEKKNLATEGTQQR